VCHFNSLILTSIIPGVKKINFHPFDTQQKHPYPPKTLWPAESLELGALWMGGRVVLERAVGHRGVQTFLNKVREVQKKDSKRGV